MTINVALELEPAAIGEVQVRNSTSVGAPGILDPRRVRTVLR